MRRLEEMIRPNLVERRELLRAAAETARSDLPRFVREDGLKLLDALAQESPKSAVPCDDYSNALCEVSDARPWEVQRCARRSRSFASITAARTSAAPSANLGSSPAILRARSMRSIALPRLDVLAALAWSQ